MVVDADIVIVLVAGDVGGCASEACHGVRGEQLMVVCGLHDALQPHLPTTLASRGVRLLPPQSRQSQVNRSLHILFFFVHVIFSYFAFVMLPFFLLPGSMLVFLPFLSFDVLRSFS